METDRKKLFRQANKFSAFDFSSSHSRARVSTISIGAYGGPPSATSTGHMAAAVTKIYSDQPPASAALWVAAVTVEQAVIMQGTSNFLRACFLRILPFFSLDATFSTLIWVASMGLQIPYKPCL